MGLIKLKTKPLVFRLSTHRRLVWSVLLSIVVASCGGSDLARREVGAGEAAGEDQPGCGEITRFARQLVDVGIDYDYDPTESPADLAARSDVAFAGVLTGGFSAEHRRESSFGYEDRFVGYEIRVDEVIVSGGRIDDGDVVTVSVRYSPNAGEPEDYEAAIAVGAPVVIFAVEAGESGAPGGLIADIEGFATACEGQQPMGWVGGGIGAVNGLGPVTAYGGGPIVGWTTIDTLDELVSSARHGR